MELKSLHRDVLLHLSQWLGSVDLLSLSCAEQFWNGLLNYQPLWVLRAKQCGIYQPEFEQLDVSAIKAKLILHMKNVYRQILTICPPKYAKRLCEIVINDDAVELENSVLPTAIKSVRALLPIALQFGRINIIHSIFTHFKVQGGYTWLLFAIRNEYYSAIKYILEVQQLPLLNDQPYLLFPVLDKKWDQQYGMSHSLSCRRHGQFQDYNSLIIKEIICCRHPKIVAYLKNKLNDLLAETEGEKLNIQLYAKLKRHSLDNIEATVYCESPNLKRLK